MQDGTIQIGKTRFFWMLTGTALIPPPPNTYFFDYPQEKASENTFLLFIDASKEMIKDLGSQGKRTRQFKDLHTSLTAHQAKAA